MQVNKIQHSIKMQAVILAAGKSTRTYPLTLTKPKPMLKVANKTLLEHNLNALIEFVSEVIIVVGYKKEVIKNFFGNKYKNIKIKYVEQKEQLGTAHAISLVEELIKNRFILMMADDIYSKNDVKNCVRHRYSILTARIKNPQNFGVVVERNGIMADLIEKPQTFISDLISTALYVLDKNIFNYIKKIEKSPRGEFELPDTIKLLSKNKKIYCVKSKKWLPIVYPWDLLKADKALRKNKATIGKNARILGNAKIRDSSIGDNCIIKGKIKNSVIMDNSIIEQNSVVENSVIGENVYFSGKALSKNNVFSAVKGKQIFAGQLGAIIADNCKIQNSIINAGCKIWPGKIIVNEIIGNDAE